MFKWLLGSINFLFARVTIIAFFFVFSSLTPIPPGTLILMADGSRKPVEHLEPGDMVMSGDPRPAARCVGKFFDAPPGHFFMGLLLGETKIFFEQTGQPLEQYPARVRSVQLNDKLFYDCVELTLVVPKDYVYTGADQYTRFLVGNTSEREFLYRQNIERGSSSKIVIQCSSDQMFLVFRCPEFLKSVDYYGLYTYEWLPAKELRHGDCLINNTGQLFGIRDKAHIDPSTSLGIACKKALVFVGASDYSHKDYLKNLPRYLSYEITLDDPHLLYTYEFGLVTHNFPFEVMVQIGIQWGPSAAKFTWGLGCAVAGIVGGVLCHKKLSRKNEIQEMAQRVQEEEKKRAVEELSKNLNKGERQQFPEKPPRRDPDPHTPVGHKRYSEKDWRYEEGYNSPATIRGRDYSDHAVDRMQSRGIPPSVVENTIQQGTMSPDAIPGRMHHYDPINNVSVITEAEKVVTTFYGN